MTTNIEIVEVSARDGLQSEKKFVATLDKLALIKRAIDAGLRRIEVTSFVNPKRVPKWPMRKSWYKCCLNVMMFDIRD